MRAWVMVIGVGFGLLVGCGPRFDRACAVPCQRDHDACMLAARTSAEVERCDEVSAFCMRSCRY